MRARIVATSVAPQTSAIRVQGRCSSEAALSSPRSCRPMSRKTTFSRTNCTVRQLLFSAMRELAVCSLAELCPSSSPQTTTASTPEAWISSAGRKAT